MEREKSRALVRVKAADIIQLWWRRLRRKKLTRRQVWRGPVHHHAPGV
jgi:hypothetical protein